MTLADIGHVWLRAYVNETDIGKIRLGETATVTTDSFPGKQYAGRISFISEQAEFTPKSVETHAERVTLVYRIRIDIDNPTHELVPGLPADAKSRSGRPARHERGRASRRRGPRPREAIWRRGRGQPPELLLRARRSVRFRRPRRGRQDHNHAASCGGDVRPTRARSSSRASTPSPTRSGCERA